MKLSFLLFSIHLAHAPVAGTSVVTPTPCKDDPEFRFKQEREKTCDWVAEKPLERCEKEWKGIDLSYYCPRSCGLCEPSPAPSSPPSGSPSTPPTGAPSTPPSAAPTGCDPELCFNNPDFKHKNCGRFDCEWVAKKTESRCYKEDNNEGLTVFAECPESCAASDFCLDVASKDGLEGCDGDNKYLCPITCGLCDLCPETSTRVSLKPLQVDGLRGGCPAPVEAVPTTPAPTTTPVPTLSSVPSFAPSVSFFPTESPTCGLLCDWDGVGCTCMDATELDFGKEGGASGTIPSEIGELTLLTDINFASNDLSGTIPSEMGQLTALTLLQLERNELDGTVPSEIGELTGLSYLYLYDNGFSGSIPSEIGQATSLKYLYLYDNNLTGSIPAEMASLTSLIACDLSGNQFTDTTSKPSICDD